MTICPYCGGRSWHGFPILLDPKMKPGTVKSIRPLTRDDLRKKLDV